MIGPLASLASSFTWCAGSTVYSKLSKEFTPSQISFTRALVALPLFLLSTLFFEDQVWGETYRCLISGNAGWLLLSMLASYGIGDMFFFWSTRALGVPGALALASSYPFWSAAAGFFWDSQALSVLKSIGIACTVIGTVLVVLVGYRFRARVSSSFLDRFEVGVALGFLTSISWAVNTFAVSRGMKGLTPHVANSVRMVIALVLCPSIAWILTRKWRGAIPLGRFKQFGWAFFLEAYGGSFFFVYGFSHAPLAVASALSSLAPVIAVPVAWMTRQEPVSGWKALGVCLAVTGAILLVL